MLTIILMALWLGFVAARKGRKWYIWAPIGAAISLALNFAVFLPIDLFLGGKEYDGEIETYAVLLLMFLNVTLGLIVTTKFIKKEEAPEGEIPEGEAPEGGQEPEPKPETEEKAVPERKADPEETGAE